MAGTGTGTGAGTPQGMGQMPDMNTVTTQAGYGDTLRALNNTNPGAYTQGAQRFGMLPAGSNVQSAAVQQGLNTLLTPQNYSSAPMNFSPPEIVPKYLYGGPSIGGQDLNTLLSGIQDQIKKLSLGGGNVTGQEQYVNLGEGTNAGNWLYNYKIGG